MPNMKAINVHNASYAELKAWVKDRIEDLGYNPFGMYHMQSTQSLRDTIINHIDDYEFNASIESQEAEPSEVNSVENAENAETPSVERVLSLLQEAIYTLKQYIDQGCDCEKVNWQRELKKLEDKAFAIQAELG